MLYNKTNLSEHRKNSHNNLIKNDVYFTYTCSIYYKLFKYLLLLK